MRDLDSELYSLGLSSGEYVCFDGSNFVGGVPDNLGIANLVADANERIYSLNGDGSVNFLQVKNDFGDSVVKFRGDKVSEFGGNIEVNGHIIQNGFFVIRNATDDLFLDALASGKKINFRTQNITRANMSSTLMDFQSLDIQTSSNFIFDGSGEHIIQIGGDLIGDTVIAKTIGGSIVLELRGDQSAQFAGLSKDIHFGSNAKIITDAGSGNAQLEGFNLSNCRLLTSLDANDQHIHSLEHLTIGAGPLGDGTHYVGIPLGTAPTTAGLNNAKFYTADITPGNAAIHAISELGHVIKFFTGAALTAIDATATDGTIGTNDTITNNIRTRLNELEARMQAAGSIF